MKIGQLRHRVEIQAFTVTFDEWENQIEDWATIASAWASIEPISGSEFWAARQMQAETTHKVTMRYIEGVHPAQRILFGTRIFEIESVVNREERGRWLELMCKERV